MHISNDVSVCSHTFTITLSSTLTYPTWRNQRQLETRQPLSGSIPPPVWLEDPPFPLEIFFLQAVPKHS